jgi:F-type H+-transporting ATPase subunit epsilon
MPTFELEIVTPVGNLYSGVVTSLRAPGTEGGFGVLERHHPMVASLGVGELLFREEGGGERRAAVGGGLAEITRERVTILAETAEFPEAIDVARAELARDRARDRLATPRDRELELDRADAALVRAMNRLKVAERSA